MICGGLRQSPVMTPSPRLRTASYQPAARRRLAEAVVSARKALGYDEPAGFAKLAGVSPRALWSVENAEPGVGEKVLDKVARAIPGWSTDTPRRILDGQQPPPVAASQSAFSTELQARLDRIGRTLGYEAYVEARDLLLEAQRERDSGSAAS